jgi:hypothetical protein
MVTVGLARPGHLLRGKAGLSPFLMVLVAGLLGQAGRNGGGGTAAAYYIGQPLLGWLADLALPLLYGLGIPRPESNCSNATYPLRGEP